MTDPFETEGSTHPFSSAGNHLQRAIVWMDRHLNRQHLAELPLEQVQRYLTSLKHIQQDLEALPPSQAERMDQEYLRVATLRLSADLYTALEERLLDLEAQYQSQLDELSRQFRDALSQREKALTLIKSIQQQKQSFTTTTDSAGLGVLL